MSRHSSTPPLRRTVAMEWGRDDRWVPIHVAVLARLVEAGASNCDTLTMLAVLCAWRRVPRTRWQSLPPSKLRPYLPGSPDRRTIWKRLSALCVARGHRPALLEGRSTSNGRANEYSIERWREFVREAPRQEAGAPKGEDVHGDESSSGRSSERDVLDLVATERTVGPDGTVASGPKTTVATAATERLVSRDRGDSASATDQAPIEDKSVEGRRAAARALHHTPLSRRPPDDSCLRDLWLALLAALEGEDGLAKLQALADLKAVGVDTSATAKARARELYLPPTHDSVSPPHEADF